MALVGWGWSPEEVTMWLEGVTFIHPYTHNVASEEKRGAEIDLISNGQCINRSWLCSEASIKTITTGFAQLPRWWKNGSVWKMARTCKEGMKLCTPTSFLPYLALLISSIWLYMSCVLYNKLVMISKTFPWVLSVILANYQTWEGHHENLDL